MATSPLVADISPLVQSLQQFTPQAKEDRRIELAGLQQQQDFKSEQLIAMKRPVQGGAQ